MLSEDSDKMLLLTFSDLAILGSVMDNLIAGSSFGCVASSLFEVLISSVFIGFSESEILGFVSIISLSPGSFY